MAKSKVLNILNMDTPQNREKTVRVLFENAKNHKGTITDKFRHLDEYYHNQHYSKDQVTALAAENGWDFTPPVLPDPFIQVESQLDPLRPEFTFKGRDDDMDSANAKIRQAVVEFILYNNRFDELMPENERNMKKLGTAFWKVAFDGSITGPGYVGDIVIGGPDPANIFPDPSAYCMDECEYIDYAYRMHRMKARRIYNSPAQREILDSIGASASHGDTEIYTRDQDSWFQDDSFQVVEHWYRDDEGDIACSVQIENKEVKWIEKYWESTRHSGNKMYPIVEYYDIPDNKSFWGKGEIETIWDLVDAADREFLMAILNDMLNADDMIVIEENSLKKGTTIQKTPGGIITAQDNKGNSIHRLGGREGNGNVIQMIEFIQEKIQETNGNFDTNQGQEPVRVTTSSGIAQLNEKAAKRADIKKADRTSGFRRLYELIDWSALEFYNTDRMILIRGKKEGEDQSIKFNSDEMRTFDTNKYDALMQKANEKGQQIIPGENDQEIYNASSYYPRIDSEIVTTDGMKQSKAFTMQATTEVMGELDNLTPAKAELIKSNIEIAGLPNQQDIDDAIDEQIQTQQQAQQAQMQQSAQVQDTQGAADHPVDSYYNSLTPEKQKQFLGLTQAQQLEAMQGSNGNGGNANG